MKIEAKVIADSLSPKNHRLTTLVVTMPRYILAEFNTHRLFTRSSASSRAIRFEKMVESVNSNPFIPMAWQKDHAGMQGTEYFTDELMKGAGYNPITDKDRHRSVVEISEHNWLQARNSAVDHASFLNRVGITKQLCNRLLEPFMYHTVLVSATEWDNFFELRCPQYRIAGSDKHPLQYKSKKSCIDSIGNPDRGDDPMFWLEINKGQADIHMMATTEAIWDAMNESTPKQLKAGEWHIPFGEGINRDELKRELMKLQDKLGSIPHLPESDVDQAIREIATAMCARISYKAAGEEDKPLNVEADLRLFNRLRSSKHASAFEFCAKVMTDDEYHAYAHSRYSKTSSEFSDTTEFEDGWCRNYRGFIQLRALVGL